MSLGFGSKWVPTKLGLLEIGWFRKKRVPKWVIVTVVSFKVVCFNMKDSDAKKHTLFILETTKNLWTLLKIVWQKMVGSQESFVGGGWLWKHHPLLAGPLGWGCSSEACLCQRV